MLFRWIVAHIMIILGSVINIINEIWDTLIKYIKHNRENLFNNYIMSIIGCMCWLVIINTTLSIIVFLEGFQTQIITDIFNFISSAFKILVLIGIPVWVKFARVVLKFLQSMYVRIRHNYAEFESRGGYLPNHKKKKNYIVIEDES